ncbi:MAG TPA: BTAD domain-containing putative transcriptional regulator [Longimicrobiales bacterium]|nr:BTAD domain-containing putative transcriptional regulator [Longimicrobiales bacterium]
MPSAGPRRLAFLAVLAAAGPAGITRDRILGILWPESDEDGARHALSQTLYSLRRETGRAWTTGTTQLRLDPTVKSDIGQFRDALNADQLERAAALYTGPFLDGFYLAGAAEFEQWVEETRAHLKSAAVKALETLARRALENSAWGEAAEWWRRLGVMDPFNARYAAHRIRALIASGEHATALTSAREYDSRVRRELDVEPAPVIAELLVQLRSTVQEPPPLAVSSQRQGTVPVDPPETATRSRPRLLAPALMIAGLAIAAVAWQLNGSRVRTDSTTPFLAVGAIEARDTIAPGPVLRDMLATNLARVHGIRVVANSRLLELLPVGTNPTSATTSDAARRAGAEQILEGELAVTQSGLVLTLRRVALRSGLVLQGYTFRATDLFALTDSATAAITSDFELDAPPDASATVRTHSEVAYALYEQGLRAYYGGDFPATLRFMSAALERDSTFAMAATYAWLANRAMVRHAQAERLLPVVQRLAARTGDRERLWIQGMVAHAGAPLTEFLSIARELTSRFPDDPDGHILLGFALAAGGDWAAAVAAFDRSIAIDSAAGATRTTHCRVCEALYHTSNSYTWWDSVAASERTFRRLIRMRPTDADRSSLIEAMLRQGRRADAEAAITEWNRVTTVHRDFGHILDRDLIRTGRLDELEARLLAQLRTASPDARGEMPWLLAFALRNQGRMREAFELAVNGVVPNSDARLQGHHDRVMAAITALESGQPRESARRFLELADAERANNAKRSGLRARGIAWYTTLGATALAAAGDTAAVRALADSVERIGAQSTIARDYRSHHFLHGLLLQRQNRHADAVSAFHRAIFSLTDGYTRINLELARSLTTLRRYPEAIAVLQPALRGGVDGSNTYLTHTELHEAIAHVFYAAGQRDSAAAHYAAVERAWRRADTQFAERYRVAQSRSSLVPQRPDSP